MLYATSLFSDADMLPRLAASPAVIERIADVATSDQCCSRARRGWSVDSNVSQSVAVYCALNEPRNRFASVRPSVAVAK